MNNKSDIYLWAENDDRVLVSSALLSLKRHLKIEVGTWFLVGPKGEHLERMGYDLGVKTLVKPEHFTALAPLVATSGDSGRVLIWSSEAVLLADWVPWHNDQSKLWPNCHAAVLTRAEIIQAGDQCLTWEALAALGVSHQTNLPENQVKVLPFNEYEKALKGSVWPFSPAVIILEKSSKR